MKDKQIEGFRVLPLKFSEKNTSYHEIFIKQHVVRHYSAETPAERTLFVLNVPPYATEDSFQRIFSTAGPVDKVIFKKNPIDKNSNIKGFKIAFVIFKSSVSLLNALKLVKLKPLSTPENTIVCGIDKWVKEYNEKIVDPKILKQEINEFMADYDKKVEDQKKEEKLAGEEDEDGWITVTKHSRNLGLKRTKSVEDKIKDKLEKRRQKKELKNFYTFQIRESKKKHLANLRQKFEEDKKKINFLKQARKFKPF